MSKFCINCGAAVQDDAAFCINCGASINKAPAKKSKKPLVITLIIVGAILSLVVEILACVMLVPAVINYVDGYPSEYTDPVALYYDALYKGDVDNVWQMAPAECWAKLAKQTGMSRQECVKNAESHFWLLYRRQEIIANGYGEEFSCIYTISEQIVVSEKRLAQISAALEEEYGIDANSVKEGYQLRVDFFPGERFHHRIVPTVIKIDNKWYMVEWETTTYTDYINEENSYTTFTANFCVEDYVSVDD